MEEVFKDVVGFEDYFQISNLGRVFSKRSNKLLKLHTTKTGYVTLATKIGGRQGFNKCFKIHRLVAEAFIPNPENKPEVNHIDGIKTNNKISNLEWVTSSENKIHSNISGLRRLGINNPQAKLTLEQLKIIRESNKRHTELSIEMNVSEATIRSVRSGNTYKDYTIIA